MLKFAVVACCLVVCVFGYPEGAPSSACGNLIPSGHGTRSNPNHGGPSSGYNLIVTPTSPQGSYSVTLQGLEGKKIMGFMIQALSGQDGIGSFTATSTHVKVICGNSAVTQTGRLNENNIAVDWQGPLGASVTFKATVVQSLNDYYYLPPVVINT